MIESGIERISVIIINTFVVFAGGFWCQLQSLCVNKNMKKYVQCQFI